MSFSFLYTTILSKNNLTELDAEPFKKYYDYVNVYDDRIIIDKSHGTRHPESFWEDYSLSNPEKIIIETFYSNKVCPSEYGVSVLYNGYRVSCLDGAEIFDPYYCYSRFEISDDIKDRAYKASEVQILFYILNILKSWDFAVTDGEGYKLTSGEISKMFIERLYDDSRLEAFTELY